MTVAAIRTEGLGKTYRGKKWKTVQALEGLNLTIAPGEVYGFLGPNGAGKSTTIKTLMGLINPTAGSAWLFDQPVDQADARKNVGYLPENPALYDFLTACEYLDFVGRSFGMDASSIQTATVEALELVKLSHAANRPIRGFSKGMVQRLGLAQTLVHDPDLYIFDEPMSGLDPLGRALVKNIIRDLKARGKTIFFSSHITADVETVCDRVGIIVGGRLRSEESVAELLRQGVEGYLLRLEAETGTDLESLGAVPVDSGVWELLVPKAELQDWMGRLSEQEVNIQMIEPKRKDLEAFFLDIVARTE